MKRPNITPGPWKTHLGILKSVQEEQLADLRVSISPFVSMPEKEVREANARAITAVPKLLAILEQMAECRFSAENCASLEVASARIQSLARLGLKEAGYTFD